MALYFEKDSLRVIWPMYLNFEIVSYQLIDLMPLFRIQTIYHFGALCKFKKVERDL